jgi:hypothetical protein
MQFQSTTERMIGKKLRLSVLSRFPPPVMIESAAARALVTHILCWTCAMCFSAVVHKDNNGRRVNAVVMM